MQIFDENKVVRCKTNPEEVNQNKVVRCKNNPEKVNRNKRRRGYCI